MRGRDFIIGACDDDTDTVSVFGQLLAPAAAVLKQRVAAMVNGLCADDPRSAGERRSDAAGAIAEKQRHPGLPVRIPRTARPPG